MQNQPAKQRLRQLHRKLLQKLSQNPLPRDKRGGRDKRDANAGRGREQTQAPTDGTRETGTVKWFNRTKGFGFIVRESGEEIFVHQRSIRSSDTGDGKRRPALKDGQTVTFTVANREKGLQAEDVAPA